jgi:type IV pilus assembly protein PilC
MPVYQYEAVDRRGRNMTGSMPADDESNLEQKLRNAGLWLTVVSVQKPTALAPVSSTNLNRFKLTGRRGRRELIDFCTLMNFQVKAGITLVRALDVACQDCRNPGFRAILQDLQRQIQAGQQFHEALTKYPRVFSTHFVSVLRAGELSSNLPEAFDDLREYLEWADDINSQVRQASLYPSIILVVVFCFTVFLFSFIIPKFAALLNSLKIPQPLLTRIIFGIGGVVKGTWWLWLPLLLLVVVGVPLGRRYSKGFNLFMDRVKLNWPIFGELNLMLALSRFTHNLAILYRSGVPILQALQTCQRGLIGNAVVDQAVAAIEQDVKTGSAISEAMHRQPVFSALLLRMVNVGESSGNLDAALNNVSDYYNQVIPRRIKTVFTVLEPMLMLFLIFMVGSVALAIYLPIISLMGAIKG